MPDGHADAEGREYQPATGLAWLKTVPTESTGLYPVQSGGHIQLPYPHATPLYRLADGHQARLAGTAIYKAPLYAGIMTIWTTGFAVIAERLKWSAFLIYCKHITFCDPFHFVM